MNEVTRILTAIEQGNVRAAEELLPLVYQELRQLATQWMKKEKPGQTLQATALVHEAYIKLVGSDDQNWSSLAIRCGLDKPVILSDGPVELPKRWIGMVDKANDVSKTDRELLATCVKRSRPIGEKNWTITMAAKLGLESTLRPRGRPRIENNVSDPFNFPMLLFYGWKDGNAPTAKAFLLHE